MKKGVSYPLRSFDPSAPYFAGNEGHDVLGVSGNQVRPAIGGRVTRRHRRRSSSKRMKGGFTSKRRAAAMKGGFIPSIMEPFVALCSKYVAPMAFLSGYKLMNSKSKK
jgi:hypothetical protein